MSTSWNAFLTIPSAWTAELMGHAGFNSLTIDMQHGLMDFQTTLSMLQAIASTPSKAYIRLPWNDPAVIMHVLDAGAAGVICPGLNTPDEVRQLVQACRYPPMGFRSIGPIRASLTYGHDYIQRANDIVEVFPMIETAEAAQNLEQFLEIPGVNGLFIGPYDLSVSLGLDEIANIYHPVLQSVIHRTLTACKAHHKKAIIFSANPEQAYALGRMGFDMVCHSTDSILLQEAAQQRLAYLKSEHTR